MVCHVSSSRSVLYMLCLSVWYVSSFRTVFIVFVKICSYVKVLRTVLNEFCMIVWYSSTSRTVFNVFFTLVFCAVSCMFSV